MKELILKHQEAIVEATAEAEERANASTMASAKLASLIGNRGEVLTKVNLFEEGLKVAADFQEFELHKFVLIMVTYQKKMEEAF